MARPKNREVKCDDCGNVFKSSQKNPQCSNPDCKGRNVKPLEDESSEKQKMVRDNPRIPPLPFMTGLDLETQNNMQFLMNLGLGKSPETVIKKAIQNMRLNSEGKKGGNMPDATETLEKLQNSRLIDAEVKRIEMESKRNGGSDDIDIDREFRIANLKKIQAQGTSPIETMMAMEMFKDLRNEKNNGHGNGEVEMLRNEIKDFKENQKYDDLRKEMADMRNLLLETTKNKAGDTQTGLITQMSTIFANRDTAIEKFRADVENVKREANERILQDKIGRLEQAIGGRGNDLENFKNTIGFVKEISKEFNPNPQKKTGMEAAQELITNTMNAIKGPILEPIGQAMAQSIANQGQQIPQQPIQQEFQQPSQQEFQPKMSESEISKGLVNISSE